MSQQRDIQQLYWREKSDLPKPWFLQFQWLQYLLLITIQITAGWSVMQGYADLYRPTFECAQPDLIVYNETKTTTTSSTQTDNDTKCKIIKTSSDICDTCSSQNYTYSFDEVKFESLTVKLDLVCENNNYLLLAKTLSFYAKMIGAFTGGIVNDNFGRKKAILWGLLSNVVSQAIFYIYPFFGVRDDSILVYYIVVFCWTISIIVNTWSFYGGLFILNDFVPNKYKGTASALCQSFWSFGYMLVFFFHFFSSSWKDTHGWQALISLVLFLLCYFYVEESMYYLISRKNYKEAEETLMRIQEKTGLNNGKLDYEEQSEGIKLIENPENKEKTNKTDQIYTALDLFNNGSEMIMLTLRLFVMWSFANLAYYGLTINGDGLPSNYYINNLIFGTMDIISYAFSGMIMNKFGRRLALIFGSFGCAGLLFLSTVVNESQSAKCAAAEGQGIFENSLLFLGFLLYIAGRFCAAFCFSTVYKYSEEIYPVQIKGNALGLFSFVAKIVASSSPLINYLADFYSWLPGLCYTSLGILAGVAVWPLKETRDLEPFVDFESAKRYYKK